MPVWCAPALAAVVEVRVSASADDAEESSRGDMSLSSTDLELVDDGSDQWVGMRFTGLDVPQGAAITAAWIQFESKDSSSGSIALTIRGQAADAPASFSFADDDISSRPMTDAAVAWAPGAWTSGAAGAEQRTPDLSLVLQEIVSRPGWTSGRPVALIVSGSGRRTAWSYEGKRSSAPLLHVEYASAPVNRPPSVAAGPDQELALPASTLLQGAVADDGLPEPAALTTAWSQQSGPAPAAIADPSSPVTEASFPVDGVYILRLSAGDGELSSHDDVAITVIDTSKVPRVAASRIAAGADDAEESASGSVSLSSSDIELIHDGSNQTVGLRFTQVQVPRGASISAAWVQFESDASGSTATALTLAAQIADDAPALVSSSRNISSRPRSSAEVAWAPPAWTSSGSAGPAQRTPDLSTLVQEIVSRPGWQQGNALVLLVTGSGKRTARSYEGDRTGAALLHVEYFEPPQGNLPPAVDAGPDLAVVLPAEAALAGSVQDDGLPDPPGALTVRWSQASGPGLSSFADPEAPSTTVSLGAAGTYVFRLTAADGLAQAEDEVTVIAHPEGTEEELPRASWQARIAASEDDAEESSGGSVSLSSTDLEIVQDSSTQTVGLRFQGVDIPPETPIVSAWVQFEVDENGSAAASLAIRGEAADSAPAFSGSSRNISSRPLTAAAVAWTPAPWSPVGSAGPDQRTPDLSAIIQEIVDRPGWARGNALALIVGGSGKRVARAYDGKRESAPVLHVEYLVVPDGTMVDQVHWTILGQDAVAIDWRGPSWERTIHYGTTPGALASVAHGEHPDPVPDSSPGPFWEARITGLQENTLYHYRIGHGPESTFRTPPPRGDSGFWVAAEGDIGGPPTIYPNALPTQEQIASDNPAIPGDDRPAFVLAVGDLAYGDQSSPQAVDDHFNAVMAWSRWAAYMPAWGNHEDDSSLDDRNNYEGRFDFPNSQDSPDAPEAGGPGEEWMWFDYGHTRFISYPEPFTGAWADWQAKADPIMAEAQADAAIRFIVTFGHRPAYSSGSDHEGDEVLAQRQEALAALHPKYVLNVSAHSHHYERSDPALTGGIVQIVAGGGGATLGGLKSSQPSWSAYRLDHLSHVKMLFLPDRIEGYAVCGPPGSGASDDCVTGEVVEQWVIPAP